MFLSGSSQIFDALLDLKPSSKHTCPSVFCVAMSHTWMENLEGVLCRASHWFIGSVKLAGFKHCGREMLTYNISNLYKPTRQERLFEMVLGCSWPRPKGIKHVHAFRLIMFQHVCPAKLMGSTPSAKRPLFEQVYGSTPRSRRSSCSSAKGHMTRQQERSNPEIGENLNSTKKQLEPLAEGSARSTSAHRPPWSTYALGIGQQR